MAPDHESRAVDTSVEEVYERVREIGRENEKIMANLVAGEKRVRKLARAVWRVQEDERRRLARELHDGIGQTLTALKNHLAWLEGRDVALMPGEGGLGEAVALATEALDDTRELSRLLRPPVLDDLGLAPALRWLGRTVGKRFSMEVETAAPDLDQRQSEEIETVVFRIAQEALTNAAKHAAAKRVELTLAVEDDWLALEVADDGSGFDVDAELSQVDDSTGVGLRGMRDRAELFGGRLSVESNPGGGTVVRARLPLAGG